MKKQTFQYIIAVTILGILAVVCYQFYAGIGIAARVMRHDRIEEHVHGPDCDHAAEHVHGPDCDHGPVDAAHAHDDEIMLSDQALKNIGLNESTIITLQKGEFFETTTYPGIVTARTGRSEVEISSPAGGTITRIYFEPGEALAPNAPLFDIDLTNEEMIDAQTQLISLYQKLEIVESELERLGEIAKDVAPKALRDAKFQKLEVETEIANTRNKLLLYGLTDEAIDRAIRGENGIIRLLTVHVPDVTDEQIVSFHSVTTPSGEKIMPHAIAENVDSTTTSLQLLQIDVEKGMRVASGQTLGRIADYSRLYIQGNAFAYDITMLNESLKGSCAVSAIFDGHGGDKLVADNLCLRSVGNLVDSTNRTLTFLVDLPNERLDDNSAFVQWLYKPGQRCELRIGTESIDDCFVVPNTAVVREGAESYVFRLAGVEQGKKIWQKTPVHVVTQNRDSAAIENDGAIAVGQQIAGVGASQMLIALNTGSGKTELQSACSDPTHNH